MSHELWESMAKRCLRRPVYVVAGWRIQVQ